MAYELVRPDLGCRWGNEVLDLGDGKDTAIEESESFHDADVPE